MNYRKESVCPLSNEITVTSDDYPCNATPNDGAGVYPFAVVLRLRVLQVVCGISALVMGTVAFIEERGQLNLAMAFPAGCATVLAAGAYVMNYRKESVCPLSNEITVTSDDYPCNATPNDGAGVYPFAVVLRLRVLQVVCGISALVMGTVAFIEERGQLNLAMAFPAGCATVLAADERFRNTRATVSIHTSRGFGGYQPSTCGASSSLRFLGPSARVAAPLVILWSVACCLHVALVFQAVATLRCVRFM
ncbi:hypothetical protein C0J52_28129 [Blattella germanica]|nr:hypothetical protein C0J52_28129 [Blattella germanica]